MIDAHLHYTNFFRKSEGIDAYCQLFSETPIERVVLLGMPVMKKWGADEPIPPRVELSDDAPVYYDTYSDQIIADVYTSLPPHLQSNTAPLLSGFNPTDRFAVKHVLEMLEKYDFWRGIGEILLRHGPLSSLTLGEQAYASHPAMMDLYDLCVARKLPILVHQNANDHAAWQGSRHITEIETVLQSFPDLTFVWAHGGRSKRTIQTEYHTVLERLLAKYPNLYLDVSWTLFDEVEQQCADWIPLIERYAERVTFGSDNIGKFSRLPEYCQRVLQLQDRFNPDTQQQIFHRTAEQLYFPDK